jgi:hypothetical protein
MQDLQESIRGQKPLNAGDIGLLLLAGTAGTKEDDFGEVVVHATKFLR